MEHCVDAGVAKVPKCGGVARDALADFGLAFACGAVFAKAFAAFANPEAKRVTRSKRGVMAAGACDVLVARENRIKE